MQLKTILIIGLAAASLTTSARQRKKKAAEVVPAKLISVPGDTFSYAIGVAQSSSLKTYLMQREGVDSAHIDFAIQALRDAATLTDEQIKQKAAYAAGLRIAQMNKEQVLPQINQSATGRRDTTYMSQAEFVRGLVEGMTGVATLTPDSAMKIADHQFEFYKQELKQQNADFLTANAKLKDVKTTESGLQYRVIKQGTGAVATDSTEVEVNYEGKLIDGTVFDSSYKRGQSATFRPTQVIKGWTEALKMMPEGSVYELFIPYDLAYGERGNQGIPPFATLIFKVELIKVKTAAAAAAAPKAE